MNPFRSSSKPAAGKITFRERGKDVSRLEGLSDAVIGFAITLAVVSLEVPRTSDELIVLVRGLGSFAVTFGILFSVWFTQNKFFQRYGLKDDTTTWLTGGLLFVVVFYTYPLKFLMSSTIDPLFGLPSQLPDAAGVLHPMNRREHVGIVFALYGLGYGLISTMFWLLYRHAHTMRDVLRLDTAERFETELTVRLWRNSILFSFIFFGFLPVPLLPRRSPEQKAYLIGFLVLLLGVSAWYGIQAMRMRKERLEFLARNPASDPVDAS